MRKLDKPSPTKFSLPSALDLEPAPETLTALGGLLVQAFRSLGCWPA